MSVYLISGPIASGKGTLSEQISDFYGNSKTESFVLSDILRKEAKSRGLPITRDTLKEIGREMREKNHRGILGELIIPSIESALKQGKTVIVDSIRNPEEVEVINARFRDETKLIFVDAPIKVRLERVKQRGRIDDMEVENIEEVVQQELKEYPFEKIREKADIFVDGELKREKMREFIITQLEKLEREQKIAEEGIKTEFKFR